MHAREHVLPALDEIREAHVLDHHGVEPVHVERALPRRRHAQHVRLLHVALEERPDDANRLAAVVERCVNARIAPLDEAGDILDRRTRWKKYSHAAPRLLHIAQEGLVEKVERLAMDYRHLRRLFGIEGVRLEHRRRSEIARVERRVDGGGEPDEAGADALAECEAELEL